MKKNVRFQEYIKVAMSSANPYLKLCSYRFGPTVRRLSEQKKWDDIIELLTPLLPIHQGEHWLHVQLAAAYFEKLDDKQNRHHLLMAQALPESEYCPFFSWERARAHFRDKFYIGTVLECRELEYEGAMNIAVKCCCNDLTFAKSLVNDCHYLLAVVFKRLGNEWATKRCMADYMKGRKNGIMTRFEKREIDDITYDEHLLDGE